MVRIETSYERNQVDRDHYKISQFYRRHPRRNTSVGFTFVGDFPFRRYISRKNKKTIYRRFYRQKMRAKKKDSRLKYTDGF